MSKKRVIYLLVIVWAVVFATSFVLSVNIEGPRNIDTGFKRLDVLFRGQIVAFALALFTGAAVFILRGGGKRLKLIGLAPLGLTILIISGGTLFALVMKDRARSQSDTLPPKPVTAVPVQVAPAQE